MIRCARIWTGGDQNPHFEEGWIALAPDATLSFKLTSQTRVAGGQINE